MTVEIVSNVLKFVCPERIIFPSSIVHAIQSIDICTVKIKNIWNTHTVLTNQIAEILHFNDKG